MGTSYIQWNNDDVHFILEKHAYLNFYSVRSLKQQLYWLYDRHLITETTVILVI